MINTEQLYKFIQHNKITWLMIKDSAGNNIFRSIDENNTPEVIIQQVSSFLEDYNTDGVMSVEAREKSKTQKENALHWEVKQGGNRISNNSSPVMQGVPQDRVKEMIAEALKGEREAIKLENKEKEFRDKEIALNAKMKELESWGGKLSLALGVAFEQWFKNSPLSAMLAGIPNTTTINGEQKNNTMNEELTAEENESLEKSVDRLLEVFTVLEIEQISKAIAANPQQKEMILGFLK